MNRKAGEKTQGWKVVSSIGSTPLDPQVVALVADFLLRKYAGLGVEKEGLVEAITEAPRALREAPCPGDPPPPGSPTERW